jgi:hypothetical protein
MRVFKQFFFGIVILGALCATSGRVGAQVKPTGATSRAQFVYDPFGTLEGARIVMLLSNGDVWWFDLSARFLSLPVRTQVRILDFYFGLGIDAPILAQALQGLEHPGDPVAMPWQGGRDRQRQLDFQRQLDRVNQLNAATQRQLAWLNRINRDMQRQLDLQHQLDRLIRANRDAQRRLDLQGQLDRVNRVNRDAQGQLARADQANRDRERQLALQRQVDQANRSNQAMQRRVEQQRQADQATRNRRDMQRRLDLQRQVDRNNQINRLLLLRSIPNYGIRRR